MKTVQTGDWPPELRERHHNQAWSDHEKTAVTQWNERHHQKCMYGNKAGEYQPNPNSNLVLFFLLFWVWEKKPKHLFFIKPNTKRFNFVCLYPGCWICLWRERPRVCGQKDEGRSAIKKLRPYLLLAWPSYVNNFRETRASQNQILRKLADTWRWLFEIWCFTQNFKQSKPFTGRDFRLLKKNLGSQINDKVN